MTQHCYRLFPLLACGLIAVCGCKDASKAPATTDRAIQKVAFVPAKKELVMDHVELVGRLAANESVKIQSRVSGFLLETHFEDGQQVTKGDLLFTIEPDEYQAIYNQSLAAIDVAKTKLDLTEKTFARSKTLIENDAISKEEFDQNQSAVAEAMANLMASEADAARVKLDLDYTKVVSPISGRVDRALLDDGNYVNGGLVGGTLLTTVVSDRPIKAVASVDENVRLKFMRRQREVGGEDFKEADKLEELKIPCYLQLQDEQDFPHEGILEYAEIQVDQQTGTSLLRGVFDNNDGLLKPGMFVRIKVPVSDEYEAVLVPNTSIGTDQATNFVYVINDANEIEHRTVILGDRKDKFRVVTSGVQPGESVVVAGMQLIQPGMKVAPVLKQE
ncbi:Multidrug efflux pump subunit AcrA precursor [Rubripirellula amarantea]|uniref:Multidrug efflux pump subunit AcrA n=1 Tax=Rubripirellula amarantea TaxID=2527999 RepID=A0A5C5WS26_9BACT|nr:efflux RND transporter periplasmic adaptor subunit [Rubripirellula amarantea]TWT52969.1 Multidrug efflux pump subunit AcrA precursor [Rubripirellula amarantea]